MADIRILLTDKAISDLKPPGQGWYLARDADLKGFFVVVGKRKKTFTIQGDLRQHGRRISSVRVAIGDCADTSTRTARAKAKAYLAQLSQGKHPKAGEGCAISPGPGLAAATQISPSAITLRTAWIRYRDVHLMRRERSEKTLRGYSDHVERIFTDWLDIPLKDLADDPDRLVRKHDTVTQENGPYMANSSMRTLRTIYNHARKSNRELPASNPVNAVDWNAEKRRDSGMGVSDLADWFDSLAKLQNPIRREFHLLTLLSGCRPEALKQVKPEHIHFGRRTMHIPRPKGGAKRAFDIPLSRQMIMCLVRAIRYGRKIHPINSQDWIFPAESERGHLAEQKEDRAILPKWGNELRETFRTIAPVAGVPELDARLLMNHSIPGVNAGYITRNKLLENHLRSQQQAISNVVFSALSTTALKRSPILDWLAPGAAQKAILAANIA